MKKVILLCFLSCIASAFTQSENISFDNYYNFTGGFYNATNFDRTVYLNPTETVSISSNFGANSSFKIYKADYIPGVSAADIYSNQAAYNFTLWQNVLPCDYTFQNGFSDFAFFVVYDNYFQLNEIYKVVIINDEPTASLPENKNELLKIYPNPATNELKIISDLNVGNYEILDLNGRILMQSKGDKIDISELRAGHYFIKVGLSVQKFIKE